jgi:hypothetical protein
MNGDQQDTVLRGGLPAKLLETGLSARPDE